MGFVENVNKLANTIDANNIQQVIDGASAISSMQDEIIAVAGASTELTIVSNSIDSVIATSNNIGSVNAVASSLPTISSVAGHTAGIDIIASDITAGCIPAIEDYGLITDTNIDETCTGTSNIVTITENIDDVLAVGHNINDVIAVSDNTASILTVSGNTANIATVAGSITNVNTVAGLSTEINDITETVVPNIAEILAADDNAAIATAKAGEASDSAAAALVSEQNTAALFDSFDDKYLGAKDTEPLLDNDGGPLTLGALYFNSVSNALRVFGSGGWSDALTLTAGSVSTLTNKTIDSISNVVGANHIHYPVRNVSGSTIAAGTVVTAQGTQSGTDYIEVIPVSNPQTQIALGIMHTTVANNGTGLCMNTGVCVDVVDTSGWGVGTILYPNNSGGLTSTKPTIGVYQACAVVLRSHANHGTMLVEFTEPKLTLESTIGGIQDQLTGAIYIGSGTTAERPALGSDVRAIYYNDDLGSYEGWNGSLWGAIGGGATGGGSNSAFYENDTTITASYTITTGKNAMTAGPITINDGVVVTIPDGSTWTVV